MRLPTLFFLETIYEKFAPLSPYTLHLETGIERSSSYFVFFKYSVIWSELMKETFLFIKVKRRFHSRMKMYTFITLPSNSDIHKNKKIK